MEDNFLFHYQNIMSITPLILGGFIFLLLITKKAQKDILLVLHIATCSVGVAFCNVGLLEEFLYLLLFELGGATLWSILRKRGCFKS